MPAAIDWTPGMDCRLLAGRDDGLTWNALAAMFRLGRNTVIERARALGVVKQETGGPPAAPRRHKDDGALPPGHPDSLAVLSELTPSITLEWRWPSDVRGGYG